MFLFIMVVSLLLPFAARAHGIEVHPEDAPSNMFGAILHYDQLAVAGIFFAALLLLTFLVIIKKPTRWFSKGLTFLLFVVIAIGGTGIFTYKTITDIRESPAGGPVHWHADFRIFNCGEEITLKDANGLANRVGSSEIHEHGDSRIHIEGIISSLREASLGHFFEIVGGELTTTRFIMPTNNGVVSFTNGDRCSDGSLGVLEAFLWETDTSQTPWVAVQRKLGADFPDYVVNPEAIVPPGDCVVLEFGPTKEKTENICEQYKAAEARGDIIIR